MINQALALFYARTKLSRLTHMSDVSDRLGASVSRLDPDRWVARDV
jgi:hypothetical protein